MIRNRVRVLLDRRRDYGENRFVAFGYVGERLFVCVFTIRDDAYHVISLRKANDREVKDMADDLDEENPDWTTVPTSPLDAAAKLSFIRVFLEMSQRDFASLLDIPIATLRNWEQRRTEPDPIARTLIDLVFDDPEGMRDRLNKRRAA